MMKLLRLRLPLNLNSTSIHCLPLFDYCKMKFRKNNIKKNNCVITTPILFYNFLIPLSSIDSANSNTGGYLTSQYQSNQTSSAYPSQQSAYQNSQSVYGSTGLSNNSG